MATENETVANTEETAQRPKSKLMLIIIVTAVILLGAGGFAAWSMLGKTESPGVQKTKKELPVHVVVPLKSFIVNLLDTSGVGKRYLKVTMEIDLESVESRQLLNDNTPQVRDSILLLLSSRSLKEINSVEGKVELKHQLLARMNQVLGAKVVNGIYFTEFVVQ